MTSRLLRPLVVPFIYVVFSQVLLLESLAQEESVQLSYPDTRRVDQVDDYFGRQVADPYRWLEADPRESDEVAAWIDAQNELTQDFLTAIGQREKIHSKLAAMWNYERYSPPWTRNGKYFYYKNDGLQNQAVLYVSSRYDQPGRVLLDPNAWSEDGAVALGRTATSDDGSLMAYLRKESGSDWATVHVVDVDSGQMLDEHLQWARHGNVVWNAAGDGFYYTRYPEPPPGEKYQALSLNPAVYFHRLGEPQSSDTLVYSRPDHPRWSFWLSRTEDNQYLVLTIHRSTDPQSQVHVRRVDSPQDDWQALIDNFDNEYGFVGNDGSRLVFLTDLEAPTKKIVAIDVEGDAGEKQTLVEPAGTATLEDVSLIGGKLICQYLENVISTVRIYGLDGAYHGEIELPGVGSVRGLDGRQASSETFYSFASYTTPSSIYRYDVHLGESEQIRKSKVDFDPANYVSQQHFFESKDGTRVPIIVSHRRGVERDGENPTLLYGYGGFSISLTPRFSVDYAVWMDLGGVVAVANLRGGGEYGEAWHAAGKATNKQNVFDDFLAASEWLIDQEYTNSNKLAVMGGSNGGLLVGAVITQRPELFAAALPAVGVMDMLRYNQFTAGHFWRDEYGTPDDREQFEALVAYSPYHNIRPGVSYPATLVTTADTDDRVVPMHSFKFAAALQQSQAGPAPVLLRVETRAGHGAGTPITKRINLVADKWSFLWKTLGMDEP